MARNGSGTFNLLVNSWNQATNGTPATAADWQSLINDIASALTQSVSRDGQTTITGNLPMGGNKITGLAAGIASGDALAWQQLFSQGLQQDVASAATVDLGAVNSTLVNITGTTSITSFGTNYNGPRFIRFDGILTLTNSATLVLPTGANITTAAGDSAIAVPLGNPATGWRVVAYQRANGSPLVGATDFLNTTRIDVASASTVDLTASAPNTRHIRITGTTTITGFTVAVGQTYFVVFGGALTLTNNASIVTNTGANIPVAAGDSCIIRSTAANTVEVISYDRVANVLFAGIQPISASVAANALTISASTLSLDFRSTTLGSGAVTNVTGTPANLVVPSTATLGTINAVASRLVVLALNNAGTIELAVVNIAGGTNLDETGVISTTAIAAASNSATTIYSTTARTNVAYRVIGFIDSTQTTAGTWATAPSLIQGQGGQALTAMATLGYGQTWQNVLGSRTSGTTYYNTTGKPIFVCVGANSVAGTLTCVVNGVTVTTSGSNTSYNPMHSFMVPPGGSYSGTASGTSLTVWTELR